VNTCCWKNGADRLARRTVATNLQCFKDAISAKRNKTGMPVICTSRANVHIGSYCIAQQDWKAIIHSGEFPYASFATLHSECAQLLQTNFMNMLTQLSGHEVLNIIFMQLLPHMISKSRTIAMILIFNAECACMFMTHLHAKFHMPNFNCSLIIATKPKAKNRFQATAILLPYTLQK
jgi:hypothetical protein